MKATKVLKLTLAAVSVASLIPTGTVFAAPSETQTVYPTGTDFERELTFTSPLDDYAVNGDTYAFAYSTSVLILQTDEGNGERQRIPHQHSSQVTQIDYDENGSLYFRDIMGDEFQLVTTFTDDEYRTFEIPLSESGKEHEFPDTKTTYEIKISGGTYMLEKTTGELFHWNDGTHSTVKTAENESNGFSMLKTYGDAAFAVKDNRPYIIEESVASPISLAYTDFSGTENIYAGEETKNQLTTVKDAVKTAKLKKDAYYTKIESIGETFKVPKKSHTQRALERPCLVLGEVGNASIISIGDEYFITATDNLFEPADCQPTPDGETYYSVENIGVYASPFMNESTKIDVLASGSAHPVTVIEKYVHTVLSTEFCKIRYKVVEKDGDAENEVEKIGFVAANFLTKYDFGADDNKPETKGEDAFSYDTNVPTVLLAILIVGLVIIAAMYLFLVFTKKDKTPKAKKVKKKKTVERIQTPDDDEYEE